MSVTLALAHQSFDPRVLGDMHLWLSAEINGNAGNTWTDLSGSGNNGTLTNGPTYSTTGGGSILLDGVNDYVAVTGVTPTLFGNAWTFATWVRPSGAQSTRGIYAVQSAVNDGGPAILFQRQNSTTARYYINGNYRISQTVNDDVWTHCALTYDGTIFRAYKNGAEDGTYTATVTYSGTAAYLWMGQGFNGYLNGRFGEFDVWKAALSASAVSALYQRTRFRFA